MLPVAEAEDMGTSSSSCPCGRHWRPSRESSVPHALARLPDRFVSHRHSACWPATRVQRYPDCDRQGRYARLRAKKVTSLRAASSCSRRSSIRAAGARQGRPRERADTDTRHRSPIEKGGLLPFSVAGLVSGVASGVRIRLFQIVRMQLIASDLQTRPLR